MIVAFALLIHVGAFLCDTELHAIEFAKARITLGDEDMAADLVGQAAQKQVCGLFGGEAVVVSKYRASNGPDLFLVTQYNFFKDHRTAFGAEPFVGPENGSN